MKKIKILTIILTVILISLISFVGIYIPKQNRMENIVKDYNLGMNLLGYRQVRLEPVKEEEQENKIELTDKEIKEAKEILEKRLKKMGAQDYFIRTEKNNIVIEMAENEDTDHLVGNSTVQGKFEVVDSETKEVLMNNADIELANVLYSNTEAGTMIYLNIQFDEEGTKKFEDITTKYKTIEEVEEEQTTIEKQAEGENNTETAEKEENKQPEIIMQIDGNEIITQSFENPIKNGQIQLAFSNAATTNEELQETISTVSTLAIVLDNGMLPNEYSVVENEFVHSDITEDLLFKFAIVIAAIILIALLVLMIKYKSRGIIASILYIGFVALYLLIIRYTNVVLTLEGIAGILVILIINYIITKRIIERKAIINEDPLPIAIAILVFCFIGWAEIASLGMVMFWGVVTLLYHKITIDVLNS